MLDTRFPRLPGDIGNPKTFDFAVRYKTVAGATPATIVAPAEEARLWLPEFIQAAQSLEREGAQAITTSCGFLSIVQHELATAVKIPVITSSLLLVPLLRRILGARCSIGIITADQEKLSSAHLQAAGIVDDWPILIRGMQKCPAFAASILVNAEMLDSTLISAEVVAICQSLQQQHSDLAGIVFECTNLQPYAAAVKAQTALPVWGIVDLLQLVCMGFISHEF